MAKERATKKDLVDIIAEQNGITKVEAEKQLDHVVEGITTVLSEHKDLSIRNFATFGVKFKKAHKRVSNLTGETVDVPDKYTVKAKFSKLLV
ncbi:HU family DNA-binding protein [Liquorilactobacillus mali]|uniref:DNA-binding protein HU n=1 Tax=Liquorilactobacillus mali KCTC 3596 = DSM 20444 TaxID=1046596 RepID=A0A0R2E3B9_9LACO|nr:HU family DNA-binding protein [Liquorilactobacillus mali]KRN10817.1 DNA-binding protein HU [Liquorilactobacillus mali KCTC 3596 = DSM 20444]